MPTPAQRNFIELLVARQALKFGDFTLKSGRKSPYFINTGCFHQGGDLAKLGAAYADTILARFGSEVQVVFGPAYKGPRTRRGGGIRTSGRSRRGLDLRS